MFKKEAEKFLNEQLQKYIDKAKKAENDDDIIRFTDEAHKLYITLNTYDGFDSAGAVVESNIPQ